MTSEPRESAALLREAIRIMYNPLASNDHSRPKSVWIPSGDITLSCTLAPLSDLVGSLDHLVDARSDFVLLPPLLLCLLFLRDVFPQGLGSHDHLLLLPPDLFLVELFGFPLGVRGFVQSLALRRSALVLL